MRRGTSTRNANGSTKSPASSHVSLAAFCASESTGSSRPLGKVALVPMNSLVGCTIQMRRSGSMTTHPEVARKPGGITKSGSPFTASGTTSRQYQGFSSGIPGLPVSARPLRADGKTGSAVRESVALQRESTHVSRLVGCVGCATTTGLPFSSKHGCKTVVIAPNRAQ